MTPAGHPLSPSDTVYFEKERGVTEIKVTRGVAHATVTLVRPSREALAEAQLGMLQLLATVNVPVFLIKLHPDGLSFALAEAQIEKGERLLQDSGAPFILVRDLALVETIAGAMRDLSGVMAGIYEALIKVGVPVRQTSDAYNAVLCLVAGDGADRAAEALRHRFSLSVTEAAADATEAVSS